MRAEIFRVGLTLEQQPQVVEANSTQNQREGSELSDPEWSQQQHIQRLVSRQS